SDVPVRRPEGRDNGLRAVERGGGWCSFDRGGVGRGLPLLRRVGWAVGLAHNGRVRIRACLPLWAQGFGENRFGIVRVADCQPGVAVEGEEWRDAVGYEGRYAVSSEGRVWSYRYRKIMK